MWAATTVVCVCDNSKYPVPQGGGQISLPEVLCHNSAAAVMQGKNIEIEAFNCILKEADWVGQGKTFIRCFSCSASISDTFEVRDGCIDRDDGGDRIVTRVVNPRTGETALPQELGA